MPMKMIGLKLLIIAAVSSVFFLYRYPTEPAATAIKKGPSTSHNFDFEKEEESEEEKESYSLERAMHEFKMLRNPITGTIPNNIHQIELAVASRIPDKAAYFNPWSRGSFIANQNAYQSIGPNNIAGRSRTLAFDRRNPNIMLTGGTTGGLFRSTDGGTNWTFVTPENDIRGATGIAQDPINPNTWYYGTGETHYILSENDVSNRNFGHGMFKSTDNGATWAKLLSTQGNENRFDNPFDLVNRIVVHPTNGNVYVAALNTIMRSKDGGQSWEQVLGSITGSLSISGSITDVIIPSNGSKIFAAFSGANRDRNLAGVWESTTGDVSSWRRIAGGVVGAADSVAGWQPYGKWSRIVLSLNSTNNRLFTLYKNGDSASGPVPLPEADLFRCDISSGNPSTYTWTNLKSHVPDEPGFNQSGIDPYTTQFAGYNMSITPKPDNDNILFIGGTSMYRVDLTQTDPTRKFRRVGGYGRGFFPNRNEFFIYPNHHPDIHGIYFLPGNNDVMFTASDGGIHKTTTSVMADTVRWQPLVKGLQTVHYQFVGISPDIGDDYVVGGTQDNGTLINENPFSSQEQTQLIGGDGASSAVSTFTNKGNTGLQSVYTSFVQGRVFRLNRNFRRNNNQWTFVNNVFEEITPIGLGEEGQWLTLLINDPDSSEHLYYNSRNKLYRTTNASMVNEFTWTELTGIGNTVSSEDDFTFMAVSKIKEGNKYLFFGTDNGQLFRLTNPASSSSATVPVNITPPTMTRGSYVSGIAVNPRNPDTAIVVVSNYDVGSDVVPNIFWSGNATTPNPTWQVLDGALAPVSSQSCEIVVKTTGVEYYVGTSIGLYSTTAINGSTTQWVREGTGMMKTAIIRSLKNRQPDNTLVVGTHGNGAFITRIGNAVKLDTLSGGNNNPRPSDPDLVFISAVYPTLTNNLLQYRIGNLTDVQRMVIQVHNMKGQKVYEEQTGYQNGTINITMLARGQYIVVITSDGGRYRYVQKVIKQ